MSGTATRPNILRHTHAMASRVLHLPCTEVMATKMDQASKLRADLRAAEATCRMKLDVISRVEQKAKGIASSSRSRILRYKVAILRQGKAKTRKQIVQLKRLRDTHKDARRTIEACQDGAHSARQKVQAAERTLFDALLDVQSLWPFENANPGVTTHTRHHSENVIDRDEALVQTSNLASENATLPDYDDASMEFDPLDSVDDVRLARFNAAVAQLEKCEIAVCEIANELDSHHEAYQTLFASYSRIYSDMSQELREAAFGPHYLQRGMMISTELSEAEKNLKRARVEAKEAGVDLPNSRDQESDFLSVPGEGPIQDVSQFPFGDLGTLDVRRINDWLLATNKTCKFQFVEAQYALSGADVEPWESSSSRGEAGIRRKIDGENGYRVGSAGWGLTQPASSSTKKGVSVEAKPHTSKAPDNGITSIRPSPCEHSGLDCELSSLHPSMLRFAVSRVSLLGSLEGNVRKQGEIPAEMMEDVIDVAE
jgi:hypothetical protein